jgi:hypothetical protein
VVAVAEGVAVVDTAAEVVAAVAVAAAEEAVAVGLAAADIEC